MAKKVKKIKKKKPIFKRASFWIILLIIACMLAPTDKKEQSTSKVENNIDSPDPTEAPTETPTIEPTPYIPPDRGDNNDGGWNEPLYEGFEGYVSVFYDRDLKENPNFYNENWKVPTFEKDKQFYNESGSVNHKTKVTVISQDLNHTGHGFYEGYLLVEDSEKNQFYIKVGNFVINPYWEIDNLNEIVRNGYCIAEFNQKSDYYPVTKDNEKVSIPDGTKILLTERNNWSIGNVSSDIISLKGIYFENQYGKEVFFNADDLTFVY